MMSKNNNKTKSPFCTLPKDTKKIINNNIPEECNFHLRFNKLIKCQEEGNERKSYNFVKFDDIKFDRDGCHVIDINKKFIDGIIKRQNSFIKRLSIVSNLENPIIFTPDWRMIIGLGNESVYEISMTLHHIYGIPYIPGQAVKGAMRNWIIAERFNGNVRKAFECFEFGLIFGESEQEGTKNRKGSVFFFDAFPVSGKIIICPDIINPHYSDYYSFNKPPADYYNPIPVEFLTVKNTDFRIVFGIRQEDNITVSDSKLMEPGKTATLMEIVEKWLYETLMEHGIGAKTAVGYGYMKENEIRIGE